MLRWILWLLVLAGIIAVVWTLRRRSPTAPGSLETPEREARPREPRPPRPGLSPAQELQGAPPDMVEPASHDPAAEARRAAGPRGAASAPPAFDDELSGRDRGSSNTD